MGWRSINRFTKTSIIKLIGILLNFVSLLFGSTIVLTIQNKSNFICKIYMTMLPYMYNCCKRKSLKPSLRVYPLPTIWKPQLNSSLLNYLGQTLEDGFKALHIVLDLELLTLIIILVIILVINRCLSTKIVQTKQTQLVRTFSTKSINSHHQS